MSLTSKFAAVLLGSATAIVVLGGTAAADDTHWGTPPAAVADDTHWGVGPAAADDTHWGVAPNGTAGDTHWGVAPHGQV